METRVECFAAMGTRVELHLFGSSTAEALAQARREIEAVDDALTIHRPSPATIMNERLAAGQSASIDDPLLLKALVEVDHMHALTGGLFDPAAGGGAGRWEAIAIDVAAACIAAARPVLLDFGGFGKGYALDRACRSLREAGVTCAFLSAGESSIAVIGQHPLGGKWPLSIPHPSAPDRTLVELLLEDEALSVSSTVGGAPGRCATIRPRDGSTVGAPRTAVCVERDGALAEAMSTALLAADGAETERLVASKPDHRFAFDHDPSTTT